MKSIDLLKEGHGLRYSPPDPASEAPAPSAAESGAPREPSKWAGKAVAAVALVALAAGGAWLAYKKFGPKGPRLAAVRPPKVPAPAPKAAKAPAPEAAKAPAPKVAKAPAPKAATTLPPPAPTAAAALVERWHKPDKSYPFTILVASFQKEASASAFANRLAAAGHPATVAPTDLGKKGRWFRVVLDRYEVASEAREAAARLKGKKPIDNALPMRLPFAVEVGREPEQATAKAARDSLAAKGLRAVLFPEAAGPEQQATFRLLAGAFPTKDQAEAHAKTLRKAGHTAQVVTP